MNKSNDTDNAAPAKINWKARFYALAESVRYLGESAEWSYELGCDVPHHDAWDHLEKQRAHLSDDTRLVRPLPLPLPTLLSDEI